MFDVLVDALAVVTAERIGCECLRVALFDVFVDALVPSWPCLLGCVMLWLMPCGALIMRTNMFDVLVDDLVLLTARIGVFDVLADPLAVLTVSTGCGCVCRWDTATRVLWSTCTPSTTRTSSSSSSTLACKSSTPSRR